jgi:hypothetical protein
MFLFRENAKTLRLDALIEKESLHIYKLSGYVRMLAFFTRSLILSQSISGHLRRYL